jgi:cytochrome c-type biogenesis protein CcmF
VTDKRGLFKSWTLLLALIAFSLSLLGTFLVRSGVLVSVHSFAADPARGIFILVFLVLIIGGALTLYAWRAPRLKSQAGFELGARESFLLFNNILLVIAAATVFGGTLAPLIADALGLPTLSVGTPYFKPTFLLPVLPLLMLAAVGMHAGWKRGHLSQKKRALLSSLAIAVAFALAIAFGLFSSTHVLTPVGLALGIWIVLSALIDPLDRLRRRMSLSRGVLGMTIAHIGLGVFVIAVSSVESFTVEHDAALGRGESAKLGAYEFRFDDLKSIEGPNYEGVRAQIAVRRHGRPITVLHPEKRRYWVQNSVMTEAGIYSRWGSDLFVALGEDVGAGRWSIRAQVRPLINFIWIGAFIMGLGGAVAASDRRYRAPKIVPAPYTGDAVAKESPA